MHETQVPSQGTTPPATPPPATLKGTQHVRKFGKATEPEEPVTIRVALWRLPSENIDLVLSVNEPGKTQDTPQASQARDAFESVAASLCIRDWSLFA